MSDIADALDKLKQKGKIENKQTILKSLSLKITLINGLVQNMLKLNNLNYIQHDLRFDPFSPETVLFFMLYFISCVVL